MKKINVLVVDDDEISLKLLELMLKNNPLVAQIIKAKNGLEGINILERKFDTGLILLDLSMPVMNGIEFLINLESREYLSMIPVVVISTDETKKQEVFRLGAYDFMLKPIRQKELNMVVENAMNILL
ncbi:PleD family two-component system response regulator [Campylobacter fetus]|uniref:Response regulator receiver protein n=1 Tax=Campylobacter fetus subsp. testudinum TaxID=1507806 RepID=A0AAX0HDQ4_CAMFE|nr:response regulator [Campylobacter fetus]AGZ82102.1 receiver domain protein [Campylobacter fetus subsp. testudinum 03-427]ALV65270.1 receiver domain protein [Campylobacter fetus subsp. testudinum Sp3]AVK81522.1 response regulator [Campylobacter fetus subsp. testudinum]EAI4321973.1 response regulator [Campylobacter fetus]EAI4391013.1 response regulator [Campylobacter fetus]